MWALCQWLTSWCCFFRTYWKNNHAGIIYLPSFSQLWAKQVVAFFKHKVNSPFSQCQVADVLCILTLVHFERPQHWGLLYFDVCSRTVFFDDGLKIRPQSDTLCIVQNMLCIFKTMSDGAIPEQHWNKSCLRLPLPRINMPVQVQSGINAGSCGVGVMLAIEDIIPSGNCCPTFSWRFENMVNLHKELMALIVQFPSSFLKEQPCTNHLSSILQSIVGKASGGVLQAQGQFSLFPVPSRPQHWGLLYFDVSSRTVFFDDSLKIRPQSDALWIVQNMLCIFTTMSDGAIPEQH